ncbi:MAG: deoxyribose-phosphate aldolase [Aequorivita sp.]
MAVSQFIDHTLLKPTATPEDIIHLCEEAKQYWFFAVCVNGCYVSLAKNNLRGTAVKVAAVVGFPLGASASESKIEEARICIKDGADEIDMVLNLGFLKAKKYEVVGNEIEAIKKTIGNKILKVILETCYLSDDEIRIACQLAQKAGADYVKTSTGFGTTGATKHAVKVMINEVGEFLKIKVSGGIKDLATAQKYIEMGVSRIGTSSGVEIVTSPKNNTDEHTY